MQDERVNCSNVINAKGESCTGPQGRNGKLSEGWMGPSIWILDEGQLVLWWNWTPSGQRNTSMHSYGSHVVYPRQEGDTGKVCKWVWRAGGCRPWNLQSTLTTGNTSPSLMRSVAELQAWGTVRDLGSGKTILGIVDIEMQLVLRVKQVLWATNCVLRFCRGHSTGLGPVLFTGLTSG